MAFTSEVRANYIELANDALDNIPIKNIDDFKAVSEDLAKILNNSEGEDLTFKEYFEKILRYLHEPNLYVKDEEDYVEYLQIIKKRIQEKITELNSLNPSEQSIYINEQNQRRNQATRSQETIAMAEPRRASHERIQQEHLRRIEHEQRMIEMDIQRRVGQNQNPVPPQSHYFFQSAARIGDDDGALARQIRDAIFFQ